MYVVREGGQAATEPWVVVDWVYLLDRGGLGHLAIDRKLARFFGNLMVGPLALEDDAHDVTLAPFALAEHKVAVFVSDQVYMNKETNTRSEQDRRRSKG